MPANPTPTSPTSPYNASPVPADVLSVHGRASLKIPYTRWTVADDGTQTKIDISTSTIFIEIPAANIRRQLIASTSDPQGLTVYLSRDDVEKLPTSPTPFAIIDETAGAESADLDWEGMIVRTGYKGEPNG